LSVRGMIANHKLAGAIGDSGWSELVRQLEYKSAWHGRTFVRIGRWYPSSKLCSTPDCGFKNDAMPLDVREWRCPACGVTHDRDVNAAKNILAVGLADSNDRGDSMRPERGKTGKGSRLRSGNRFACCAAV
jgi:putative transposase